MPLEVHILSLPIHTYIIFSLHFVNYYNILAVNTYNMGLSTRNYELRFACLLVLQDPKTRLGNGLY